MKPVALANALTSVFLFAYLACAALVYIVPDFVFSVAQSWFHGWNLAVVRVSSPASLVSVVFGAVSLGVYIWVLTYLFGRLYAYFANK